MRRLGEAGQTTTEYLMISGIVTMIAILMVIQLMQPRLRGILERMLNQILNP